MSDTRCIFLLLATRCVLKHFDAKLNFYYHLLYDDGLTGEMCIVRMGVRACVCVFVFLCSLIMLVCICWLVVFLPINILHVFETIKQNVDSIIDIRMIELNC